MSNIKFHNSNVNFSKDFVDVIATLFIKFSEKIIEEVANKAIKYLEGKIINAVSSEIQNIYDTHSESATNGVEISGDHSLVIDSE